MVIKLMKKIYVINNKIITTSDTTSICDLKKVLTIKYKKVMKANVK